MELKIWGNLRLLERYHDEIMANDYHGREYNTGQIGPQMMRLLCNCGHEFSIETDLFPGRRAMRDCGRQECPFAQERLEIASGRDRPRYKALGRPKADKPRRCLLTLYVNLDTVDALDALVAETNSSRSEVARSLLDAQLRILSAKE